MKNIITKLFLSQLEVLAVFPIFLWLNALVFAHYFEAENWAVFFGIYALGMLLGYFIKRRWLLIGLSTLFSILIMTFVDLGGFRFWLLTALFIILMLRGTNYGQKTLSQIFPTQLMWMISLPSYFISYFIFRHTDQLPVITAFSLLLVICLFVITNSSHLRRASLDDGQSDNSEGVGQSVKLQNKIYIIVTFILILLITQFNFISAGIIALLRLIFSGIGTDDVVEEPVPEEGGQDFGLGAFEAAEPHWFFVILEQVVTYVTITGLVLLGLFIIYQLLKKIPRIGPWVKRVMTRLIRLIFSGRHKDKEDVKGEYEDESSSVFDFSKSIQTASNAFKKSFKRKPNWRNYSPRQKARFAYQLLLKRADKKGLEINKGTTATQLIRLLEDDFVAVDQWKVILSDRYEKARYSTHEVEAIDHIIEVLLK